MRPEHEEEIEVLESIYEGDDNFSKISDSTFQYKYENECENKSFLIQIHWGDNYPDEAPRIDMDIFFNNHLLPPVKSRIVAAIEEQADINIGMSMTFTLFEWLKEEKDELLKDQPTEFQSPESIANSIEDLNLNKENVKKDKKPKDAMTKTQKRRMWDRITVGGERERGFDWVDIIKHLSQTGHSQTS